MAGATPRGADVGGALRQFVLPQAVRLRELRGENRRPRPNLRGEALQAAAQEADAVRLAVDIADFPRRLLRDVRPSGDSSFLDALAEVRAPRTPS